MYRLKIKEATQEAFHYARDSDLVDSYEYSVQPCSMGYSLQVETGSKKAILELLEKMY